MAILIVDLAARNVAEAARNEVEALNARLAREASEGGAPAEPEELPAVPAPVALALGATVAIEGPALLEMSASAAAKLWFSPDGEFDLDRPHAVVGGGESLTRGLGPGSWTIKAVAL